MLRVILTLLAFRYASSSQCPAGVFTTETAVMVIGGLPDPTKVAIYDNPHCPVPNLGDVLDQDGKSVPVAVADGTPFLLRGQPTVVTINGIVVQLNDQGTEWKYFGRLENGDRSGHHSVSLTAEVTWITGGVGINETKATSTTELVYANGTIKRGPDLPDGIYYHCSAISDDGEIFIVGLVGQEVVTWVFQYADSAIKFIWKGPSMQGLRGLSLGCNMAYASKNPYENQVLVVAGGGLDQNGEYLSIQRLDLEVAGASWWEVYKLRQEWNKRPLPDSRPAVYQNSLDLIILYTHFKLKMKFDGSAMLRPDSMSHTPLSTGEAWTNFGAVMISRDQIPNCSSLSAFSSCPEPEKDAILILGGDPFSTKATILGVPDCIIDDMPKESYYGAGGRLGEKPTYCGGLLDSKSNHGQCYQLQTNGTWTSLGSLKESRAAHHALSISKDWMWITGGLSKDGAILSSTEFVFDNPVCIRPGPELPSQRYGQCAVLTDDGQVYMTGGNSAPHKPEDNTWTFHSNLNSHTVGPVLTRARAGHACTTVFSDNHDGRQIILLAGDWYDEETSSEILDFHVNGATWTSLPRMPSSLYRPRVSAIEPKSKALLFDKDDVIELTFKGDGVYYQKIPMENPYSDLFPRNVFTSVRISHTFLKKCSWEKSTIEGLNSAREDYNARKIFTPGRNAVLLFGGYPNSEKVTVLNHTDCIIDDMPRGSYPGAGGNLGGLPTYCGGIDSSGARHRDCFQLQRNGKWKGIGSMMETRVGHHALAVGDDWIWITGGTTSEGHTTSSTESLFANPISRKYERPLPEARYGHCAVMVDDGRIYMTGGNYISGSPKDNTWIFTSVRESASTGPSLTRARAGHSCTTLISDNHDGRQIILLAGGWTSGSETSAEILDFHVDGAIWTRLPIMPYGLHHPGAIPIAPKNKALLFDKNDIVEFSIKVDGGYEYQRIANPDMYQRSGSAFAMIPREFLQQCTL